MMQTEAKVKPQSNIKLEGSDSPFDSEKPTLKSVSPLTFPQDTKIEHEQKIVAPVHQETIMLKEQVNVDTLFKTELEKILQFVLMNMGKNNQAEMQES